ncbi:alpha/beta hydrolase [Vitellibacter sp. q18]|nr:alpha/beta hydrolase [Aequorivita lutea]
MIFTYRDIPIHYEIRGSGPAIVFLHGFLESASMWTALLPKFENHRTVITVDLPGHGKSGIIANTHSMELMAEVVDALLLQVQICDATFIGHSMGGYVALAFAELFPQKVEKIILLNSTPVADSPERRAIRNRALKIIDQNPQLYIGMAIGNLFAESSRERFSEEIDALKLEAFTFPVAGIKAAIKGMRDRKDRTEILTDFPREKIFLLAVDDPILPFWETKKVAAQCGAKTIKLDGGHLSLLENFETVAKYLLIVR